MAFLNPKYFFRWGALIPLLLLLVSFTVYSDSVDDAYHVMENIYLGYKRVTPNTFNVEHFAIGDNEYYGGKAVYEPRIEYNESAIQQYYYIAKNYSGLMYVAQGLPIISFSIIFDKFEPESAAKDYSFTLLSISHKQYDDRYLSLIMKVQPSGYEGYTSPYIEFIWGLMIYNFSTGEWKYQYWFNKIIEPYGSNAVNIKEVYVYIIPVFYLYNDTQTTHLVYGFAARVKTRAINETGFGNSITIGEIPYTYSPLTNKSVNITVYDLEKKVMQLYGWNIWIGLGLRYMFSKDALALDTLTNRAFYNQSISVTFRIKNPSVFSVDIDPVKLMEFYELNLLPYTSLLGEWSSSYNYTVINYDMETKTFAAVIAIGAALVPAWIVSRVNKLFAAIAAVSVASTLLLMMFLDIRILFLSMVSIGSIFIMAGSSGGGSEIQD